MEEWNEIQHIGCDSNEHDWLYDLLSENSCYTLEWGIIKKENGEMSIYGKQWKYSLLSSQCWNLKLISFYMFPLGLRWYYKHHSQSFSVQ